MGADRERVVLGVDPEGVEADRLEHVVTREPFEAAVDVGAGEREHVADVQAFGRRVGEHHEVVERSPRPIDVGLVDMALFPQALPSGFHSRGLVRRGVLHKCLKLSGLAPS